MFTSPIIGGENIRNEIIRQLQEKKVVFDHFIHRGKDPYQVAQEIGVDIREGLKCLIMRGKKSERNYLICVLGHQKVDMRTISTLIEENCELEKIDVIQERYGLTIGGIPPFGNLLGLEVYFDSGIQNCTNVIFSCGLVHESVRMKLSDLLPFIHPKFVKVAKE